jgi:ABC-type transporter Mla subunit MlaD
MVNAIAENMQKLVNRVASVESGLADLQAVAGNVESLSNAITQETARAVAAEQALHTTLHSQDAAKQALLHTALHSHVAAVSDFITAFANSIYISNSNGTAEFDYTDLLGASFIPLGITGHSTLGPPPAI